MYMSHPTVQQTQYRTDLGCWNTRLIFMLQMIRSDGNPCSIPLAFAIHSFPSHHCAFCLDTPLLSMAQLHGKASCPHLCFSLFFFYSTAPPCMVAAWSMMPFITPTAEAGRLSYVSMFSQGLSECWARGCGPVSTCAGEGGNRVKGECHFVLLLFAAEYRGRRAINEAWGCSTHWRSGVYILCAVDGIGMHICHLHCLYWAVSVRKTNHPRYINRKEFNWGDRCFSDDWKGWWALCSTSGNVHSSMEPRLFLTLRCLWNNYLRVKTLSLKKPLWAS